MKLRMKITVFSLLFSFTLVCTTNAQEEKAGQTKKQTAIEESVLGMNVTGNKELPNVLYIIPWKGNATLKQPPTVSRLVDEIYAPVDPDVFSKQVDFYYQITAKSANIAK